MSSPKLFTVEEANQLLPRVRQILSHLRKLRAELERLDRQKAVEELSWLREDGSVSPQAKEQVAHLDADVEKVGKAFEEALKELDSLGAQLKDLEEGLVDFFISRGLRLVYLCWKEGEDEIRFWHDLESGFAGRRPLEQL